MSEITTSLREVAPSGRALAKSRALMVSRRVGSSNPDVFGKLVRLQATIFDLDFFGEEHWSIDYSDLQKHWSRIYRAASAFGNVPPDVFLDLRRYQQIEIAMRRCVSVTSVSVSEFYRLKCSDVRLLRFLVSPDTPATSTCRDLFDFTGEIVDDVEDLAEDAHAYNGNRLLAAAVENGVDHAVSEYRSVLSWIAASAAKHATSRTLCACLDTAGIAQCLRDDVATLRFMRDLSRHAADHESYLGRRMNRPYYGVSAVRTDRDRKKHFAFDSTECEMPSFSRLFACSPAILG